MILWETNVGSHMWKMNHEKSDLDLFRVRAERTKDILRGTAMMKSVHIIEDVDIDIAVHEILHVINHRITGNVNFMWGIHSPVVVYDHDNMLKDLRDISYNNLSKNTYHSIKGLAVKNMKKYVVNPPEHYSQEKIQKKAKTIMRSIDFGVTLLIEEELEFNPIVFDVEAIDIIEGIERLDAAYACSPLPEKPDADLFRDYLEDVRREIK